MAQFKKILALEETGHTKYYAVSIEIRYGWPDTKLAIADCVVSENYDTNSDSSNWEIISVEPEKMEAVVMRLSDEIFEAM